MAGRTRLGLVHGLLAGLALCAAAAPAVAQTPTAATPAAPDPSNTGTVVFFRGKQMLGAAVGYRIHEGGIDYGKLRYGTYFAVNLPAGRHAFQVNTWKQFSYEVEVEPGRTHYLIADIEGDHPALYDSTADAFEAMRSELKDVGRVPLAAPPRASAPEPAVAIVKLFGRLKVLNDDGRVYYPLPESPQGPADGLTERFEPRLSLLHLGSPMANDYSRIRVRRDGWLTAQVAPGDYALIIESNRPDWGYRLEAFALLRVPGTAPATYVGDLTITIALENSATFAEPQPYHVADLAVSDEPRSMNRTGDPHPPVVEGVPAVSTWCLAIAPATPVMMIKHSVAIATLGLGCREPSGVP